MDLRMDLWVPSPVEALTDGDSLAAPFIKIDRGWVEYRWATNYRNDAPSGQGIPAGPNSLGSHPGV